MTVSKSPDRNTFQKNNYLERQAEKGLTPDNDEDTKSMLEFYESWDTRAEENLKDPEWQKLNMEYDMRTCEWMLEKVRNSDAYAQNLYAAMCNNSFQKIEMWPILTNKFWSCSWRYAGGIIADMQQKGDYINWYCSGIRNNDDITEEEENTWTDEQKARFEICQKYVSESVVTEEIEQDLKALGWMVIKDSDDSNL